MRRAMLLRALQSMGILALGLATSGCPGRHAPLVRTRTATALACPADALEAVHVSGSTWRVSGCGRAATFECRQEPWLGMRCGETQ